MRGRCVRRVSESSRVNCPPRKKRAAPSEAPDIPIVMTMDTGDLPGTNAYDPAVSRGDIDYQTAKVREEVRLVEKRIISVDIANEQAALLRDKTKLELELARASMITKEEYINRQDSLINAFLELQRLLINEACLPLPGSIRPDHTAKITGLASAGMSAIAESVLRREGVEAINSAILRVFTGEE